MPTSKPTVQLYQKITPMKFRMYSETNKQSRGGTVTDICTYISQNIRIYNSFPRPTYTLTTVTKLSFAKTRIVTWGTLVIWHLILLHQTRSAFHPKNITKKLRKPLSSAISLTSFLCVSPLLIKTISFFPFHLPG